MNHLKIRLLGMLLLAQSAGAVPVLIWDHTYDVGPYKEVNTYFLGINQLTQWDYVRTDVIGLTWQNNNGYCQELYQPRVLVKTDELGSTVYELFETSDPSSRVRTRDRASMAKLPGVFYYRVPAGVNIAQIKLVGVKNANVYPTRGGQSWMGTCRFLIYAQDGVFGRY